MDVVEQVPFGFVEHAFELRFNHLVDPFTKKTYLQLCYKFGTDEQHYDKYEVLIPTYKTEQDAVVESDIASDLQP
jgi:hypothetical protein